MTNDTNTLDLLNRLTDRIIRKFEPEKVILFGSHAWGTSGSDSDIDLLIVKESRDRPIDRYVQFRRIADDMLKNVPYDTIVFTTDELRERIVNIL